MSTVWFAAHAVYVFECIASPQTEFTVQENVLLVRARSSKAALAAATRLAKRDELVDASLTLDGEPARQRFLGIRKVVECASRASDRASKDGRVRDIRSGSEATYLSYRVANRADLRRLMQGKEAGVTIEE